MGSTVNVSTTISVNAVVCPGLSDPVNGVLTPTGTNTGDSAAFTCNSGFELVGASVVHCLSNGTWDKPSPTCLTPAGNILKNVYKVKSLKIISYIICLHLLHCD